MNGVPLGDGDRVGGPDHLIIEPHAHRREQHARGPNFEFVVIQRRTAVGAGRFNDGQRQAVAFHLTVAPATLAQEIGPSDLEPDQIVRVINDAHLVGFGIAHPDSRDRNACAQREAVWTAPDATALSSRVACSGSDEWKMAAPATRIRAPAATTRGAVCTSMPPSISIGAAVLPAKSRTRRTSLTLDSLRGIKVWPPKPGFTDMTRT